MKISIPIVRGQDGQRIQYPDIREAILTPDPGLWQGLIDHAQEVAQLPLSDAEQVAGDLIVAFATRMRDREQASKEDGGDVR